MALGRISPTASREGRYHSPATIGPDLIQANSLLTSENPQDFGPTVCIDSDMLTAEISVQYDGDWTAELDDHDAFGEVLASTFRNREYVGLVAIETGEVDPTLESITAHSSIESVDIVEQYGLPGGDETVVTLYLRARLDEYTPLQTLMYEGFLPIGPTVLEGGRERFDLLLSDRDELSRAVAVLESFGPVTLERVSSSFSRQVLPSVAGWQELLASFPPRQRRVVQTAFDRGYYEIPRETTLESIANELDITKTTASTHLRKAERKMVAFLVTYLDLASSSGEYSRY